MLTYVTKRAAWAAVLFLAITLVSYVIFFVIPVDPTRRGRGTTAQEFSLREAYSIDGPIYEEYPRFIWNLVRHGSLGYSYGTREPVTEILARTAPVTISLVIGAAFIWLLIALPTGVLLALRPRSLLDRVVMVFVLLGVSAHPLWIGLVVSYFASYRWGLFPIGSYCDFFYASTSCGGPTQWAYHLLLPWATLALIFTAIYTRMVRASVLETLHDDHVRTARAKGASVWRVMRAHVLRNALLPVVTMLSMDLGVALGTSFFVEIAYGLPGLGTESVRALRRRDLPVIVGVVVVVTTAITILSFLVDLLYGVLDPLVRPRRTGRVERLERPREQSGEAQTAPVPSP